MAIKKKTTTRRKPAKDERGFWKGAGVAAIKGGGGFALGAAVGSVEEAVSPRAGTIAKGLITAAGLIGEVALDEDAAPVLKEASKAALYGGSSMAGHSAGRAATAKLIEAKRRATEEREAQARAEQDAKYAHELSEIKQRLSADLEDEPGESPADETPQADVVPIEKPKKKARGGK